MTQSERKTCGSGLARDEALRSCNYVECTAAIAGKPAPTGYVVITGPARPELAPHVAIPAR